VAHEGFSYVQVVPVFPTPHSFSVTFFLPFDLRPFFILLKINDERHFYPDFYTLGFRPFLFQLL
jgi:hypothetical protein